MNASQLQERQMNKPLRTAIMIGLLAAIGLGGCGVKGQLEKPADAPKEEIGPDGKKPHRSFVLDGLVR